MVDVDDRISEDVPQDIIWDQDKNAILKNAKRVAINTAIILYNSTIAEITPIDHKGKMKIPGIPVLDTIYKKLYYTYFAKETQLLFTEEKHYIPLYNELLQS